MFILQSYIDSVTSPEGSGSYKAAMEKAFSYFSTNVDPSRSELLLFQLR